MPRPIRTVRPALVLAAAFAVFSGLLPAGPEASAHQLRTPAAAPFRPIVGHSIAHDSSVPLRVLATRPAALVIWRSSLEHDLPRSLTPPEGASTVDSALDTSASLDTMPAPIRTFEGNISVDNPGYLFNLPPDTNGDVGLDHYVQWVNGVLSIWTKDGTRVLGPIAGNTIWTGLAGGTACSGNNDGDPVVQYDQLANRWMISQFAVPGGSVGYHECVAVSQTPDPTGSWFRYDFKLSQTIFTDYPHFGVWPDAYYMSVNQFTSGYVGPGAVAFERDKMLAGLKARFVYFQEGQNGNLRPQLPADLDGTTLPPAGSPNYFVSSVDGTPDHLDVYRFHADWSEPAASTFTGPTSLNTAAFESGMCEAYYEKDPTGLVSRGCIPQPASAATLDPISDRLMYRLAYRNFGDHESIVANQTVDIDGSEHAGVRWYELRKSGGSEWSISQQSTYGGDGATTDAITHRWMGSIAQDSSGNTAIGYSISGVTTFPSLAYTGRLVGDPLNTMPQGEVTMFAGTGSQQLPLGRWGDYSSLSIDPADDCTFWFTSEYYTANAQENQDISPWHTRIGSFRFPACGADVRP